MLRSILQMDDLDGSLKIGRRFGAIIMIVLYFLLGIAYYNGSMALSVLESVYFSVIALMTIG